MTDFNTAEESSQLLRLTSDAYTLNVRQGPERGKAFSGPKEKDRKPVDPPPIIQLKIRDPQDPASNYLQSPYFFMACNLCDADLNRPGQLAAALQGEDPENSSQSALAGTLVSSLHRLKDTDNSDGGFFVFPDVSVRVEGEFRLRFSLFEMLKTAPKVIYIKSVHSEPFTVYSSRTFPGMAESTFLSRSFGDQGVKLRIRKEPRILGKRAAPSDPPLSETPQPQPYNPQRAGYAGIGFQTQQSPVGGPDYRDAPAGYDEPPSKRYKPAVDYSRKTAYMQEERLAHRPYAQQREFHDQYRDSAPVQQQSYYASQPMSARSSEFTMPGHQRTVSSSANSQLESPRTEYSNYGYPNQSQMYQQQQRESPIQYQYRQQQPLSQAVGADRQLPSSSMPTQPQQTGPYGRADEQPYADLRYQPQRQPSIYQPQQPQEQQQESYITSQQTLPRTLPPPLPGSSTSVLPAPLSASLLPPMTSQFPQQQQQYPTTNDGNPEMYTSTTVGGGQGYLNENYLYRGAREG